MYPSTQFRIETRWVSATQSLIATTAIALLCSLGVRADETASKEPESGQPPSLASAFTIPKTLNEGRDPFYPLSTRVIEGNRPSVPDVDPASGPATLTLKGISGTVERPLALINNQTFAEGDEQEVTTPEGRVKVMCLEIEGSKVRIKAQGQTRELMLRKGL